MILHKQYGRIPLPVLTSDPWFHKITQQLVYSIVTADKIVMKYKIDIKSLLGLCIGTGSYPTTLKLIPKKKIKKKYLKKEWKADRQNIYL